jgi:UDP-N-acetylmuramoyl-L-alanyl-D-glutamate--2,6-diaminopimelate ligase
VGNSTELNTSWRYIELNYNNGSNPDIGFGYVTSDKPRTEDAQQILADVTAGIPPGGSMQVEADRAVAIAAAIAAAAPGDLVLIAGKGHEDYQILGTTKVHFDDREEAEKALLRRRGT